MANVYRGSGAGHAGAQRWPEIRAKGDFGTGGLLSYRKGLYLESDG